MIGLVEGAGFLGVKKPGSLNADRAFLVKYLLIVEAYRGLLVLVAVLMVDFRFSVNLAIFSLSKESVADMRRVMLPAFTKAALTSSNFSRSARNFSLVCAHVPPVIAIEYASFESITLSVPSIFVKAARALLAAPQPPPEKDTAYPETDVAATSSVAVGVAKATGATAPKAHNMPNLIFAFIAREY